jgi:hypothetical protein
VRFLCLEQGLSGFVVLLLMKSWIFVPERSANHGSTSHTHVSVGNLSTYPPYAAHSRTRCGGRRAFNPFLVCCLQKQRAEKEI